MIDKTRDLTVTFQNTGRNVVVPILNVLSFKSPTS